MQAYSDPKRESDPYSLPDLEVWRAEVYRYDCQHCGSVTNLDENSATADPDGAVCPSCERGGPGEGTLVRTGCQAWWWRSCFPGCLPDSDTFGPFDSKAEALADARDGMDDDDDDDDETV